MKYNKGLGTTALIISIFALIVVGGAGYVATNPQILQRLGVLKDESNTEPQEHTEMNHESTASHSEIEVSWRYEDAGEANAMPHTKVFAIVNGKSYETGTFVGSCSEIGSTGGVDGKGLLAGELSATQCWFAGGGNEIGVFAHEDGGFQIMIGDLSEGDAENAMFRGDFKIHTDVQI